MSIPNDTITMIDDRGNVRDEVASWFTADNHQYVSQFEALLSDNSRPHSRWKPCQHYKRLVDVSGTAVWDLICTHAAGSHMYVGYSKHRWSGYRRNTEYSYSWPFGTPDRLNSGLPEWYLPVEGSPDFIPLPVDYDNMVSSALKRMLPEIKADMSLINSVLELKDFKSLPQTVKKVKDAIVNLPKLFKGGYSPHYKGKKKLATARDLVRLAADLKLQYSFNISPLISDISAIYSAVERAEKALNDLITRAGKQQRRHIRFRFSEYTDSIDQETGGPHFYLYPTDGYAVSMYSVTRYVYYDPTQFHAEIEYNYNYTQYQLEHARVLAILDKLGVNLNPAIIWNAIPWTFVIDWVIDVSRWLDQFKTTNMKPQINITQFLTSITRKRRIMCRVSRYIGVPPSLAADGGKLIPPVVETAYRRTNNLPSVSSITSSGLNSNEFTLGAALVLSRRRRRRK